MQFLPYGLPIACYRQPGMKGRASTSLPEMLAQTPIAKTSNATHTPFRETIYSTDRLGTLRPRALIPIFWALSPDQTQIGESIRSDPRIVKFLLSYCSLSKFIRVWPRGPKVFPVTIQVAWHTLPVDVTALMTLIPPEALSELGSVWFADRECRVNIRLRRSYWTEKGRLA